MSYLYINCIFFPCCMRHPLSLSTQNKHSPLKFKMSTHRLASFNQWARENSPSRFLRSVPVLYLATISIMGHVRKLRSVVADLRVKFYTGTVPCKPAKRLPPSGKILPTVSRGVTRAVRRARMRGFLLTHRPLSCSPAFFFFTDPVRE